MSNSESTASPPPDDELAFVEVKEEILTSFRFRERPESLGIDAGGCLWSMVAWPWWLWLWLAGRLSANATYHVPPRFGMSAIIGITTALALLFALYRAFDAHPLVYVFSIILMLTVVVVQMRWGHVARPASIVAGAILLPLFFLTLAVFVDRGRAFWGVCCALPIIVPVGGFLGYLAGTCAGGFFLLMEMFERYWERRLGQDNKHYPGQSSTLPTQLDDLQHPR